MKRSTFTFDLPNELIAQHPLKERDGARLLVVDAVNGHLRHSHIRQLPEWIPDGALLVPNDVKVRRARLFLRRTGGGGGEALLLKSLRDNRFEALVRPAARLRPKKRASVIDPTDGSVIAELVVETELDDGLRIIQLRGDAPFDWEAVDSIGHLPLPPYIQHSAGVEDNDRYQTIFHSQYGEAVAAPTAGLHFTPELIDKLEQKACLWRPVCLHVGLGTFRPMTAEDIEDHAMHEERYEIPEATARELEYVLQHRSRELMTIGTTSLRTLEAAWDGLNLN
ncbi:MAG: S-adenosylmethionine:tRNA ribosyltransferase-isomerase, partial [Holophagales bacterium]|nr:S-adenosylmethionine:tRNA ribosyltransferase-isomerase [Holophagales bacterium]